MQTMAHSFPRLSVVYLLLALPMIFFLSTNFPLFAFADEGTHVFRAEMVLQGDIVAHRVGEDQAGGAVDANLVSLEQCYWPLLLEPGHKVTADLYHKGASLAWGGAPIFVNVPNTAVYPPTLYLPVIAALRLGKAFDWSIQRSVLFARLVNGTVSALMVAVAIELTLCGSLFLFSAALLPMCLGQMASCSQDAMLIGMAALSAALLSRPLVEKRQAKAWEWLALLCLFTASAMARPPLLALIPLLMLVQFDRHRWRSGISGIAAVVILSIAWVAAMALWVKVPQGANSVMPAPMEQLRHMLAQPGAFPQAMAKAVAANHLPIGSDYFSGWHYWAVHISAIMGYGEMCLVLPSWYHSVATAVLAVMLLASLAEGKGVSPTAAALAVTSFALCVVGIFFIQYLTFTSVGGKIVEGVQGRYFLTLLLLAAGIVPHFRNLPGILSSLLGPARLVALCFPLVTDAVIERVLVLRVFVG